MEVSPVKTREAVSNAVATQRIHSIDAFRGITILVMIFVNELAGVQGLPSWTRHAGADDDAMTYVDIVFPAFLFIVGMSIPFALANRAGKGENTFRMLGHILLRTIGLIVLGVFMVNAEGGYNENAMMIPLSWWALLFFICAVLVWNSYRGSSKPVAMALRIVGVIGLVVLAFLYRGTNGSTGMTPQWWGILGLIGWAYLFACLLFLASGRNLPILFTFLAMTVLFFIAGKESENSSNSILQFVNAQKGHATHTGIVLAGIITSLLVFHGKEGVSTKTRMIKLGIFTTVSLVVAVSLRPGYLVSKIYATPSWALFSVAACIIVFALLFWLIDIRKRSGWVRFVEPAASNPLLAYLIPFAVFAVMQILGLHKPQIFSSGLPGVLWSITYAVAVLGLVAVLNRFKIKLQL